MRVGVALVTNQLARFAPKLYMRLTHETGRGAAETDGLEVAKYFIRCFEDYKVQLGVNTAGVAGYLDGKRVLEYGPGDILGVALLMYAHGAACVTCVDKFPLASLSSKNVGVYSHILQSLRGAQRRRADSAFVVEGNPASGFKPEAVQYLVTESGLSGARGAYDLIISRAVLEHVNDLERTMMDIQRGMKPGGVSMHQVDLKSHGLDRYVPFDFLTWPTPLYRLMYSHKGFPNRWRVGKYRALAEQANLVVKELVPTALLGSEKVEVIRPKLAKELLPVTAEELSWLGFWLVLRHPQ